MGAGGSRVGTVCKLSTLCPARGPAGSGGAGRRLQEPEPAIRIGVGEIAHALLFESGSPCASRAPSCTSSKLRVHEHPVHQTLYETGPSKAWSSSETRRLQLKATSFS